jgi:FkbM family methyltransferase
MKPLRPTAWVLVSTEHGTMLVNRHDHGPGGYGVGYQLLVTSSYEQNEVQNALTMLQQRRRHFGDGVVALDCGANIGVHTIEWAKLMHGWGEVIAVEAQERIFYALAGNISINNCFNARAIWAAVGASSGTINVPAPDYLKPGSFGSMEIRKKDSTQFIGQAIDYASQNPVQTPMFAIDGLGLPRLDLIKIDIEGMEMEALAGAEQSLIRCKPQLIVERIKTDEAALTALLEKLGYKIFPAGMNLLAIHTTDPTLTTIKIN